MAEDQRQPSTAPEWLEPSAQRFYEEALDGVPSLSPEGLVEHAQQLNRKQEEHLTRHCLNLYPGTNILSPKVTALLGSTVASRASEGHPGAKYQTGLRWAEEAEVVASALIQRLFKGTYAEVRALSGSMANMAVLHALTKAGDAIFSLATPVGAHISHREVGAAGYHGLQIHTIPYDIENWSIDIEALRREVRQVKPKLIILGASLILFPYPVEQVRAIADEVGAFLMYDAAHVAGLIAGGAWQNPLQEGAHVLTASTYKSFAGPPGGIVVTHERSIAQQVDRAIFPGMTANFHTNRMAALIVAAAEMMAFGKDYAQKCLANAQILASAFRQADLHVAAEAQGCTAGHMLALDVRESGMGEAAAHALERANIICNKNLLPWDSLKAVRDPSGLRLAVHEVTRWGMGEEEMKRIAHFFHRVLIRGESPENVRLEVMDLKAGFDKLHFCFA